MINTTGLTHPALDKITRITPIICSRSCAGDSSVPRTDMPVMAVASSGSLACLIVTWAGSGASAAAALQAGRVN